MLFDCILQQIQPLRVKKNPWYSNYYIIIIVVGLLLGLFIWFLFRISIAELDKNNKETVPKKQTVINKAVYEKNNSACIATIGLIAI